MQNTLPYRVMFILCAVLAAFLAIGCGNSGETTSSPTTVQDSEDASEPSPESAEPAPDKAQADPAGAGDNQPPSAQEPGSDEVAPLPQSGTTPINASNECNVVRDYYDGTGNWGYLTIGRHYNDAARIAVTGNYTVCKLRLKMYQYNAAPTEASQHIFNVSIFSHDATRDAPGRMIGKQSASMRAGGIVKGETNSLGQAQGNFTAIQDVYFELDVPVTAGTYWLVFKAENYNEIVWSDRLRNYVVPDSSNAYPLRGRALSYAADPVGTGDSGWSEFYSCQVRYALYSN